MNSYPPSVVRVPVPVVQGREDRWLTPELLTHVRLEILCRLRRKSPQVTALDAEVKTSEQGNRYLELCARPAASSAMLWADARSVLNDQADWLERGAFL